MNERIHGLDVARALAVFGMVVVSFKIATGAAGSGPCPLLDAMGLLEGRAAATFVVLAGFGFSLVSARAREANDVAALARQPNGLLRRCLGGFLPAGGAVRSPLAAALST